MKTFTRSFIFIQVILMMTISGVKGQVVIGTSTPNNSAILDVYSLNKGFLPPRMTSEQRLYIPSPADGLLVYDTDTHSFWFCKSGTWCESFGSTSDWILNGNSGTDTTSNFVGTTDNMPVYIKVNNVRSLSIRPSTSVSEAPVMVGGYHGNEIGNSVNGSVIAGGGKGNSSNKIYQPLSFIGSGSGNIIGDPGMIWPSGSNFIGAGGANAIGPLLEGIYYSAIVSGQSNKISQYARESFIGAGAQNEVHSINGFIGGGMLNMIDVGSFNSHQAYAAIAGGYLNTITKSYGFIGGGWQNATGGMGATVPGGMYNNAAGDNSFAAGYRAKANGTGSFALADYTNSDFTVGAANVFGARFNGGYWLTGGNVGIGTTDPSQKLEITGDASSSGVLITGTNLNQPFLRLDCPAYTGSGGYQVREVDHALLSGLSFDHVNSGGGFYTLLTLDYPNASIFTNTCKVGIGATITNPTNALHINATDPLRLEGLQTNATDNDVLVSTSTGVIQRRSMGSLIDGSSWSLSGNSLGGSEFLGSINSQPVKFYSNNSERMRIDASGNVGIGITLPSAKLDVAGNIYVRGNSGIIDNPDGDLVLKSTYWGATFDMTFGDGNEIRLNSVSLFYPTTNAYTSLGTPTKRFNELYVNSITGSAISSGVVTATILNASQLVHITPLASAPASPAKGDIYFDDTINKLRVWDGTAWQNCW